MDRSLSWVASVFCRLLFILILLTTYRLAIAMDVVIVNVGESENDQRIAFKNELVKLALDITSEKYGEYEIVSNPNRMNIARAFRELEKGDTLSLTFAHTKPEFEKLALIVRIPIRQSLDNYRLLLIKQGEQDKFLGIETLADLKKFTVGLSPNWATHKFFNDYGFEIVDTSTYSSMFRMLEAERFDYIPRALNEVYPELDSYKAFDKGLAVVPNLALFIPSSSYMFVSRQKPEELYQRLNTGVHALNANGQLSELNKKYYAKFVERASLQERRIITINSDKTLLSSVE